MEELSGWDGIVGSDRMRRERFALRAMAEEVGGMAMGLPARMPTPGTQVGRAVDRSRLGGRPRLR